MSAAASYWRNAVRHPEDCGVGNIRRTLDYSEFGNMAGDYPAYALPIGCLEKGAVPLRISTRVQTAVTGGTPAVTIGTSTDPDAFAIAADIAAGTTGYKTAATGAEMGKALAADTMFFAYISASAATGKFTTTVEFANRRESIPFREDATDVGDGEEGGGEEGGLEELAFADFVNGVYRIGGATVTIEDMFVYDSNWGDDFDPVTSIGVNGLTGANPSSAPALNAVLFPGGCTIVGCFVTNTPGGTTSVYADFELVDFPDFNYRAAVRPALDDGDTLPYSATTRVIALGTPVLRDPGSGGGPGWFAATLTSGHVSLSMNGGAVLTDTTATVQTFTNFVMNADGGASIKQVKFHPPQPDADLPGLSEP